MEITATSPSSDPIEFAKNKLKNATNVLDMDWHLSTLEATLSTRFGIFSKLPKYHLINTAEKKSIIISMWITELLRFLILNAVVQTPEISVEVERCLDLESGCTNSRIFSTDNNERTRTLLLCPSGPIRVAWKSLFLLPRSYQQITSAIGVLEPFEYDRPIHGVWFEGKLAAAEVSVKSSEMSVYKQTLEIYRKVFEQEPPSVFWPPAPEI